MMKKMSLVIVALLFTITGCSGIKFSQLSPDAMDFHPKTIAVLPATVGEHESARDTIDTVVSRKLAESGWYDNVVDAVTIKNQIATSEELSGNIQSYIQKLNTMGLSDPAISASLKDALNSEALLLTYVTSWGYGRSEGNKIARVGLGLKLIDASKGTIIWKANHEQVEEYWAVNPSLEKMAEKLMQVLMKEMPHSLSN